jgi:hypothetical protein
VTDEAIHPAFQSWLTAQRRAGARAAAAGPSAEPAERPRPLTIGSGDVTEPVRVDLESASKLVVVAARMAAGFFRPTRRSVVVWVEGDSELAVEIGSVKIATNTGRVDLSLPVRCDQTGRADVVVTFAVGWPGRPAGVYASTLRRPFGPTLVIDTWGGALVAFAWQILLTLVTQVAGAVGKDTRGNVLVPADLSATPDGLAVLPMGRFRFSGASGLKATS